MSQKKGRDWRMENGESGARQIEASRVACTCKLLFFYQCYLRFEISGGRSGVLIPTEEVFNCLKVTDSVRCHLVIMSGGLFPHHLVQLSIR